MAVFTLTEPPVPTTVLRQSSKGLLSSLGHLTDNRRTTLCGLGGPLFAPMTPPPRQCVKCGQAEQSKARIKRRIR